MNTFVVKHTKIKHFSHWKWKKKRNQEKYVYKRWQNKCIIFLRGICILKACYYATFHAMNITDCTIILYDILVYSTCIIQFPFIYTSLWYFLQFYSIVSYSSYYCYYYTQLNYYIGIYTKAYYYYETAFSWKHS